MLTALSLKDFVLVDQLELPTQKGFTVLTGETGAGKSILIDAIMLLLGGRADTQVVRQGALKAELCAEFQVSATVQKWLEEQGFMDATGPETVLIRRTIEKEGRSRAWINGTLATMSQLKALGAQLIDIHGQHDHQSLFLAQAQLELLDEFADHGPLLEKVRQEHARWREALHAYQDAKNNAELNEARLEKLEWIISELEALKPKKGEWEKLSAEYARLANAQLIIQNSTKALQAQFEVSEALSQTYAALEPVQKFDPRLDNFLQILSNLQELNAELSRDLESYVDQAGSDDERLEKVDRRMSLYFNLAQKFHVEPEGLLALLETSVQKRGSLQASFDLESLQKSVDAAWQAFQAVCQALTASRQKAAQALSELVTKELQTLSMKGACFAIRLESVEPTKDGAEQCVFMFSSYSAEHLYPLSKIASGGELSRVGLAIAVVTSRFNPIETLIFDEVDAGIGGQTAEVVGQFLHKLAQNRQVLCITHLSQVARYGEQHWKIYKGVEDGVMTSHVKVLDNEGRVEEIGRMLAGSHQTKATRGLASELLK